jgi:hypothetical protein
MGIEWQYPTAQFSDERLTATVSSGTIRIAHLGCKLAKTCLSMRKDAPSRYAEIELYLNRKYGSKRTWNTSESSTELLGRSLAGLQHASGAKGLQLMDTMRNGSDYWRPGNLLSAAVEVARATRPEKIGTISFARYEELCPSLKLLASFQNDESMDFGLYADSYARELNRGGGLEVAIAETIVLNARERIPVFYCTDPFIRGYCSASEVLGDYRLRNWIPMLREAGCHRIVLVEEMVKFFLRNGFQVEVFELDQLVQSGFHQRFFTPTALR